MPTTGQFWFSTVGPAAAARIVYVDINASSASGGSNTSSAQTILIDKNPVGELQTSFPMDVQIDWAAGVYFAVVNANPATGQGGKVVMGYLNRGAAPTVVYPAPVNDVVNTLQLDVYSHHVYVQHAEALLNASNTGILDFTYSPAAVTPLTLTPVATNNGYLVKSNQQSAIPNNAIVGAPIFDPRDFALDHSINTLFFTNQTDGTVNANQIYRLNLATPTTLTPLLKQSQFPIPADGSGTAFTNGYIHSVEVDPSTDLVYFTTYSQHPSPDASYNAALNKIYWISETASGSTDAIALTISGLPANFYPGNMTLDDTTRQIYIVSEQTDTGGVSVDDVIYVLQLSADGHSATLINTIAPSPTLQTDASNFGNLTFDELAQLGTLSATATHPAEQGANA